MKLSKNFSLREFTSSQTATRMQYKEQFNPPEEILSNIKDLVANVTQPIRDYLNKGIRISSGYRCKRLNKRIGGSLTSDHSFGRANDLQLYHGSNIEIAQAVIKLNLPFKQMIVEFGTLENPAWVHIAYDKHNNKGQILRAYKQGRKTKYRTLSVAEIMAI